MIDLPIILDRANQSNKKSDELWNDKTPCVLIIEDDRDVAVLLQRCCGAGYDSDIAYDAAQARSLFAGEARLQANHIGIMLRGRWAVF